MRHRSTAPRPPGAAILMVLIGWGARNQTLSLLASTDATTFTTITPFATYTFAPGGNNPCRPGRRRVRPRRSGRR